jgi:hypothetical protein
VTANVNQLNTKASDPAGRKRRRWAYVALVVMTVAVAAASLAISAPAWWPGHPRLGTFNPHAELTQQMRELREQQKQRLERYAWLDRQAGTIAIPIDRAMTLSLMEQQGQPSRQQEGMAP